MQGLGLRGDAFLLRMLRAKSQRALGAPASCARRICHARRICMHCMPTGPTLQLCPRPHVVCPHVNATDAGKQAREKQEDTGVRVTCRPRGRHQRLPSVPRPPPIPSNKPAASGTASTRIVAPSGWPASWFATSCLARRTRTGFGYESCAQLAVHAGMQARTTLAQPGPLLHRPPPARRQMCAVESTRLLHLSAPKDAQPCRHNPTSPPSSIHGDLLWVFNVGAGTKVDKGQ